MGIQRLDKAPFSSDLCTSLLYPLPGQGRTLQFGGVRERAGRWSLESAGAFSTAGRASQVGALTDSPGTGPPGPCGSPGRGRAGGTWCWSRRS